MCNACSDPSSRVTSRHQTQDPLYTLNLPQKPMAFPFQEKMVGIDPLIGSKSLFITGSYDKETHYIRAFDFQKDQQVAEFKKKADLRPPRISNLSALATATVKPIVIYGGDDKNIYLYNLTSQTLEKTIPAFEFGGVKSLAFSHSENFVLAGGYDGSARLFDLKTGKFLQAYESDSFWSVNFVGFYKNDELLITGEDRNIRLWQRASATLIRSISTNSDLSLVGASRDGRFVAGISRDTDPTTVTVWNSESLEEISNWSIDEPDFLVSTFKKFAWSDSLCLIAIGMNLEVRIYDICKNSYVARIKTDLEVIIDIKFVANSDDILLLTDNSWHAVSVNRYTGIESAAKGK